MAFHSHQLCGFRNQEHVLFRLLLFPSRSIFLPSFLLRSCLSSLLTNHLTALFISHAFLPVCRLTTSFISNDELICSGCLYKRELTSFVRALLCKRCILFCCAQLFLQICRQVNSGNHTKSMVYDGTISLFGYVVAFRNSFLLHQGL